MCEYVCVCFSCVCVMAVYKQSAYLSVSLLWFDAINFTRTRIHHIRILLRHTGIHTGIHTAARAALQKW